MSDILQLISPPSDYSDNAVVFRSAKTLRTVAAEIARLTEENEKLRGLLQRAHRHPSEPKCQLADDGKCPGPCVCGYFQWFEIDHALTNEIRAALTKEESDE